jgi:hypothetical protein
MLAAECAPNTKEAHDKLVQVLSSIGLKRDTVLNDARADKAKELVDEYVQGEREAVTLVNELLSDAGVSMNSVMIRALSDRIDEIERFDRLTAIAETRRNAALREIDRRRAVLGETLRLQRSRDRGRRLRGRRVSARAAASRRENRGVTSERKITANRANARASTGPRTAQGRTRAVRNALRHALSLPVCSTPALSEEVEVLASKIAGPGANAETQELARRVAEAQIDVHRVRSARHQFLSDTLSEEYESYASMRTKGKLLRALLRPIRRTYQWKP